MLPGGKQVQATNLDDVRVSVLGGGAVTFSASMLVWQSEAVKAAHDCGEVLRVAPVRYQPADGQVGKPLDGWVASLGNVVGEIASTPWAALAKLGEVV